MCGAMDDLNLNSDESIIKKIQQIIISGARYEALFTSSRLVLVESETGRIHRNIWYLEMVQAVQGMNALREPRIRLTFTPPGKETETAELVFFYLSKDQNFQECNASMDIFKDHKVPVQVTGHMVPADRHEMAGPGLYGEETSSGRPAVPDFSLLDLHRASRNPQPEEEQKWPAPLTIAIVIIVIMIVIGGIFLISPAVTVQKTPVPNTTASRVVTPSSTHTEVIPVSTVSKDTSYPASGLPAYGIWVRVSYPGNYTGYIKVDGLEIAINSSGTSIYQMPSLNTLIEGSVEKTDGSGEKLEAEVYNSGKVIFNASTAKPYGMVDIHITTGSVVPKSPTPTLSQKPATGIIPTLVSTPIPAVTTIQTQLTPGVNTTILSEGGQGSIPGKFSYSDCLSACKIAFSVDHNNGIFNDCIQTCNIKNLN
jgi:hypothetical protein